MFTLTTLPLAVNVEAIGSGGYLVGSCVTWTLGVPFGVPPEYPSVVVQPLMKNPAHVPSGGGVKPICRKTEKNEVT
jgi:hypothetical protein